MRMRKMFVSPQQAAEWLANQRNNRRISQSHVEMLAEEMRSGRWVPEQAALRFDEDGRLWDGQHRLSAIVLCNAGMYCYTEHDCTEAVIQSHGLTRPRTVADQLAINGISPKLAQSKVAVCVLLTNRMRYGCELPIFRKGNRLSVGSVEAIFGAYGLSDDACLAAMQCANNFYQRSRNFRVTPTQWMYLFLQGAPGFEEMAERLVTASPQTSGEKVFLAQVNSSVTHKELDLKRLAWLVTAFNKPDIRKLTVKPDATIPDLTGSKFPVFES